MIYNEKNYIKLKLLKKTLDKGLAFLEEKDNVSLNNKEMELIKKQYLDNLKKTVEVIVM